MKKYILTEQQFNKALTSKITKGIGLKIQGDDGDYYKSIIKTFDTDEDYKRWEDDLKEGTSIIGVMDINEPQETLQESTGDVKKKGKDIQMLETLIKKKFPFITKLTPSKNEHGMEVTLGIDVYFDLNKFYELTQTTPPKYVMEDQWWDHLEIPGLYFMRYVDMGYKDKVNVIRDNLEKQLNQIYNVLPKNLIRTKFESLSDDDIERRQSGQSFYKQWRDDKEPKDIVIEHFYPQVDVDKLILTYSQNK